MYQVENHQGRMCIVNTVTGHTGGFVTRRYVVHNDEGDEIAAVEKFDDVVPALEAHERAHPEPWGRTGSAEYKKWTPYGLLRVYRCGDQWVASRNDSTLFSDVNDIPRFFRTRQEARRFAELHMRDREPGEVQPDGLYWFDPADWQDDQDLIFGKQH